jgi:hypothetical protein
VACRGLAGHLLPTRFPRATSPFVPLIAIVTAGRPFCLARLVGFLGRPTSSISLKRPRAVRLAYALAFGPRTRSRLAAGLAALSSCVFDSSLPLRPPVTRHASSLTSCPDGRASRCRRICRLHFGIASVQDARRRGFRQLIHPIRQSPKIGLLHQGSQLLRCDARPNIQVVGDATNRVLSPAHVEPWATCR